MDDAVRILKNPYTYEITTRTLAKIKARRELGVLVVDVIETMRDEFAEAGVRQWLKSKEIKNGELETSTASITQVSQERASETE